jgi:hypothetical protein
MITGIDIEHLKRYEILDGYHHYASFAVAHDDAEFENKHPRDNDGKFAITVKGNELGGYGDIKELRQKAKDYYLKSIAGQTIENKEIGDVIFTKGGVDKPTRNAYEEKLFLIPHLPEIVKNGKKEGEYPDYANRPNIKRWIVIRCAVIIGDSPKIVRVNIREDNNGNLYYDHTVEIEKSSKKYTAPLKKTGGLEADDSLAESSYTVNIFFTDEQAYDEKPVTRFDISHFRVR